MITHICLDWFPLLLSKKEPNCLLLHFLITY